MGSLIQGPRKEETGAAMTSVAVADPRGRFFSVYILITMDHEHPLAAKTKGLAFSLSSSYVYIAARFGRISSKEKVQVKAS